MTGDSEASLREFLQAEIRHLRELFETYVTNTERRLEELNRLRNEVNEDRALYVTKTYYDAKHEDLDRRLATIDRALATTSAASASVEALKAQEKKTLWLAAGLLAALVGAASDLILTIFKHW